MSFIELGDEIMMKDMISATLSRLASAARLGHGTSRAARAERPEEPLVLYEYEACPASRRAREALTELGLPVRVRPCPKNGERFRPEAHAKAGRNRFPLLDDPNTGTEMTESDEIVAYLYETYGDRPAPDWYFGPRFAVSSQIASMLRGPRGFLARPSEPPELELELTADENDPEARRVRELLCELEIGYLREPGALELVDPNTGDVLRDVDAILAHLERYAR